MSLPFRSVRLQRYNAVQLDRLSYEDGEIFYDDVNDTLRLMNGKIPGGRKLATQEWTDTKFTTDLANYATLTYTNTQLGLKAPIDSPTFTGTVNGITSAMVGLGNVTNESKSTMFDNPSFTGTVNGVTSAMVGLGNVTNESKTTMFDNPTFTGTVNMSGNASLTTLGTSGLATLNSLSVTVNAGVTGELSVTGKSNLSQVVVSGTVAINNTLGVTGLSTLAGVNATNGSFSGTLSSTGNLSVATNKFTVASSTGNTSIAGTLNVTNNVTASAQISADSAQVTNNVQTGSATVTNNVTVGANVNISTLPTQIQHATNKQYVDTRALAMAIAMS